MKLHLYLLFCMGAEKNIWT